jgi:hypothetical protein
MERIPRRITIAYWGARSVVEHEFEGSLLTWESAGVAQTAIGSIDEWDQVSVLQFPKPSRGGTRQVLVVIDWAGCEAICLDRDSDLRDQTAIDRGIVGTTYWIGASQSFLRVHDFDSPLVERRFASTSGVLVDVGPGSTVLVCSTHGQTHAYELGTPRPGSQ